MEARLSNLRLSLDSDFKSWLALHAKRGKVKLAFLTVSLEKRDFFANSTKHRHIIYRWKEFFVTSMNSRSLPQNKTLFGLDQLAKCVASAQKSMPTIQALSSRTEGTLLKRKLCWTRRHQGSPSKIVIDWRLNATLCHTPPLQRLSFYWAGFWGIGPF